MRHNSWPGVALGASRPGAVTATALACEVFHATRYTAICGHALSDGWKTCCNARAFHASSLGGARLPGEGSPFDVLSGRLPGVVEARRSPRVLRSQWLGIVPSGVCMCRLVCRHIRCCMSVARGGLEANLRVAHSLSRARLIKVGWAARYLDWYCSMCAWRTFLRSSADLLFRLQYFALVCRSVAYPSVWRAPLWPLRPMARLRCFASLAPSAPIFGLQLRAVEGARGGHLADALV